MPRIASLDTVMLLRLWRYGTALLTVAIALFVTDQLMALSSRATLLLLLWAVMVSAWYGGPGPGIVALVLGVVGADYFLLRPIHSLVSNDPDDNVWLVFFAGASLAVIVIVWRQQQTQKRLGLQNQILAGCGKTRFVCFDRLSTNGNPQ